MPSSRTVTIGSVATAAWREERQRRRPGERVMAERVKLAIVGCGGMGRRHLAGLGGTGAQRCTDNIELVAVCDLNGSNAEDLADEAQELLGTRPRVFDGCRTDGARGRGAGGGRLPDRYRRRTIASRRDLLDLGLHTLCEKPLALTIRGCDTDHRGGGAERQDPFRRRELPARPDQSPRPRPARRRRDRRAAVHHGDERRRARQPLHHPLAAQKLTGALTLDAGCPQRRHPPVLLRRSGAAPSGRCASTRRLRYHRDYRRAGRLLREVGRNDPGHDRGDRRGRDVRPDQLRERHDRAVDRPLRRARPALLAPDGLRHARLDRSPPATATAARSARPRRRHRRSPTSGSSNTPRATGSRRSRPPSSAASAPGPTASTSRRPTARSWRSNTTSSPSCIRNGTEPEVNGAVASGAVALVYALFESAAAGTPGDDRGGRGGRGRRLPARDRRAPRAACRGRRSLSARGGSARDHRERKSPP